MKECICDYEVINPKKVQKSSDVVTRRVRNVLCPEHGRRDARAIARKAERKAEQDASIKGWR